MYDRTLIYDPNAGGNVPANLDLAEDGLTVLDGRGRRLQHWPYAEIIHAHPPDARKDEFLAHVRRPEIALQVPDATAYAAIRARAPQLRRARRGWKTFWRIMEGMPEEAYFGLVLFAGCVVYGAYHFAADLFH